MDSARNYFILALALLFVAGFLSFPYLLPSKEATVATESETVDHSLDTFINPLDTLAVEARAAYVYDVTAGEVLYAKNPELQLPYASLTKLMMAIVAAESGQLDTEITIDPKAIQQEGDSGLLSGERWKVQDLLDLTLTVSSNDGAYMIASAIGALDTHQLGTSSLALADAEPGQRFVALMNKTAERLGLAQTYFVNESGLDIEQEALSGGYGSVRDISATVEYLLNNYPRILEPTSLATFSVMSESGFEHTAENTNKSINNIPWLIGGKTGYTDLAGGNLVVVFDAGFMRPIVVAVMGSSIDGRFDDVEKLVATTLASFNPLN